MDCSSSGFSYFPPLPGKQKKYLTPFAKLANLCSNGFLVRLVRSNLPSFVSQMVLKGQAPRLANTAFSIESIAISRKDDSCRSVLPGLARREHGSIFASVMGSCIRRESNRQYSPSPLRRAGIRGHTAS
jgi:hypothetical protein